MNLYIFSLFNHYQYYITFYSQVTLFDSHGHSTVKHPNRGLVVAQVRNNPYEFQN